MDIHSARLRAACRPRAGVSPPNLVPAGCTQRGATAHIAVIVQRGCEFLSGGRRDATADEREDCCGRATVALTRAIEHTYIVSPLDMAGMIGMAQTLGVYHYGYTERPIHPAPWPYSPTHRQNCYNGMGISGTFYFQDKPPLAIAMIVTINSTRVWRRYRLVVACRDKLCLLSEVLASAESCTRDHVLDQQLLPLLD